MHSLPGVGRNHHYRQQMTCFVNVILREELASSRSLVERLSGLGNGWGRALPLASAMIVTALSAAITLKGLASYWG